MTRCRRMEQQFIPYLDGKLSKSQQESVAAHLGRCSHCTSALEGLSEVCALLDVEREVAVPVELEGEVIRRIRHLEEARAPRRWVLPLAMAASVAGLAVLAGWMTLGNPVSGTGGPRMARVVPPPPAEPVPLKASGPIMPPAPQVVARVDTAVRSKPTAEAVVEADVVEDAIGEELPMPGPEEVPSDLLDALDMFVHFPIIRDLERFEHFEAIWTASDSEAEDDATTRGG